MKKISIAFLITCLTGCFGAEPQKTGLEGKLLPTFNLLAPDSSTWIRTNEAPKGKSVALYYFNPHCPYCKAQTKEILQDIDKLAGIQFYFITPFPFSEMKKYWKENELGKYPNISIGTDTASAMGNYFEVTGVPYIAIYGTDQRLNNTFMGKVFSSQIKKVAEQ